MNMFTLHLCVALFALSSCAKKTPFKPTDFPSKVKSSDGSTAEGTKNDSAQNSKIVDEKAGTIQGATVLEVPAPLKSGEAIEALKEKCSKLVPGTLKTTTQVINYPERSSCEFGKAPNLGKDNYNVSAQEVSANSLILPAGDICAINIKTQPESILKYDDFLIMTLDSRVIFNSNSKLLKYLTPEQGIYTWDFNKIAGKKIEEFKSDSYCLGSAANCSIPGTEKKGTVVLNLTIAELAPISAAISGKSKVSMNLIATGDNNDSDCSHLALDLDVTIDYIPKR